MSDLFDDVSRIVASPMPRREALKLIGGIFAGAALGKLGAGRVGATPLGNLVSSQACDPPCSSDEVCCKGDVCLAGHTCCGASSCAGENEICCDEACLVGHTCCGDTSCAGENEICCQDACQDPACEPGDCGDDETCDQCMGCIPLAITLNSFTAEANTNSMTVAWQTVSELDNLGFNLHRGVTSNAPDRQLNQELIPSQVPGSGQGFAYSWVDHEVVAGETYYYWLSDVDLNGTVTPHGPVSATLGIPTAVQIDHLAASTPATPWRRPLLLGSLLTAGIVRWLRETISPEK